MQNQITFFYRYDHLAKVITRILDERPDNSVDLFEDVSADVKKTKFTAEGDTLIDRADRTGEVALAEIHHKLFVVCLFLQVIIKRM